MTTQEGVKTDMEALVTRMITESADRLGLAHDCPVVQEAIEVARMAVRDGWDAEDSFGFGRQVLIRSMPTEDHLAVA